MKNDSFKKSYAKNYLNLLNLFWTHGDALIPDIEKLRSDFGIERDLEIIDIPHDSKNYNNVLDTSTKKLNNFLDENIDRLPELFKNIDKTRKKLDLGKEWNSTLVRYMVTGLCLPPSFSVFYYEENDKIIFEINKSTTKADLDQAWKATKDLRKSLYGKIRTSTPSQKTFDNFRLYTESIKEKVNNPFIEHFDGNHKNTDRDIIGTILPDVEDISEKSDRKRVNKLRVGRHRYKKLHNK